MPIKGGPKEAAKMILEMGAAGKKLLEKIRQSDPKMAKLIEENLVSLEDIQYLSPVQLVGFLREINLETFGKALRGIDPTISKKILDSVSTGIRLDIEDGYKKGLLGAGEVEDAQAEVVKILKAKIDTGEIVIDPDEQIIP